jgi:predicted short-subunit dehydrogenase-like oxidoreductase (DUF2520 family)
VGTALAVNLKSKGYHVAAVASRSPAGTQKLAAAVEARAFADNADAARTADLVFITTPDGVIAPACEKIAGTGGFRPGQLVAHTSGALPAAVLRPAEEAGAVIFSLHPLQSFASPALAVERLPGSYFTFEGDPEALPFAERLVAELGGRFFRLEAASKPLYHAAACVASNYLVSLMRFMYDLAEQAGLQRELIFEAFSPLIHGTLNNIGAVGPTAALTGPIVRGDADTIRQHARAMGNREWQIYRILGLYTVQLARERGLAPESSAALEKIFCEVEKRG